MVDSACDICLRDEDDDDDLELHVACSECLGEAETSRNQYSRDLLQSILDSLDSNGAMGAEEAKDIIRKELADGS